jgi:hypothetical protein
MATNAEENNLDSKVANKQNSQTSNVRFELEGSQRPDDLDGSLDEIDEFLELSTLSKNPSTSSLDSATNISTNTSSNNTKTSLINGTNGEYKSSPTRYAR